MGFVVWMRFLAAGNWQVAPDRIGLVLLVTIASLRNSLARLITDLCFFRQLAEVQLPDDPIFIIGHWRTGTTLLHELMSLDASLRPPTTYECFNPGHFLLTERGALSRRRRGQGEKRRPSDNVRLGSDRPQEDEFALMNLGAPSHYAYAAFPHHSSAYAKSLCLHSLSDHSQALWRQCMAAFVRRLRVKDARRIVFKSPPHTAKIEALLDLFPSAKFIHLSRSPYSVIPSSRYTAEVLIGRFSLQACDGRVGISEIIDHFNLLHYAYRQQRCLIPDGHLCELRYEDLVRDPVRSLSEIYEQLRLEGFESVRREIELSLDELKSYTPNSYQISAEEKRVIALRCQDYFDAHGYCCETGMPHRHDDAP